MTTMTSEPVHIIRDGAFVCLGTPESPCRHYPACECEQWDTELHGDMHAPAADRVVTPGHENVPQDSCWLAGWFDAVPLEDMYVAEDGSYGFLGYQFPDGPIEWEFDDGIEWHYADDTVPVSGDDDE